MLYTADFETTTQLEDCRVWAYGICEIGNHENFIYGNNIDDFMKHCSDKFQNNTYYFQNLKFDGEFIFYWLFRNGFKWVNSKKELETKTFCTLISDKGAFYSIEVCFWRKGKKINKAIFLDSLKILNFSVEKVAKGFDLTIKKLKIDYKEKREVGHILTPDEVDYLRNDVEIMARALKIMFDKDMNKMTIGSDALHQYKNIIGMKSFEKYFPCLDYDSDIRLTYKGGWTYLNDKYKGKIVNNGIVLDVNSLYPYVMYYKPMPYGYGEYFTGEYTDDELYPLYVQRISCSFDLKENHVATIQIKKDLRFNPTEYLKSSRDTNGNMCKVTLFLTNVDLKLFLEHYEVYNLEYIDGYKFKASENLFKKYIDKWIEIKIQASIEKNEAMRTIAKLMLNALYGKLALNPVVRSKIPVYDEENDLIHYTYGEYEIRKPIYIPAGTFITSYAREKTIRAAQSLYDRFIYADTDSLHLEGLEIPENLLIDKNELGAWKYEFVFSKGKYLRAKCYMEKGKDPDKEEEEYTKITCAGMPDKCYSEVNFENFEIGTSYNGKLQTKRVSGGIVLLDSKFTIKKSIFSF